ncbi:MAG: aminoacyl-tRNA hydrolase [Bacteroidetes bacterium]|nr:aminoacyl-tRNA hydrolase [Bacteroidota bacterium]
MPTETPDSGLHDGDSDPVSGASTDTGAADVQGVAAAEQRRLCVIGLGNPGLRYARTRHNIGFHVLDRLADMLNIRESSFVTNHYQAFGRHGDWSVILCKPWTYMNLSGEAVILLMDQLDLRPAELLVVYDEVQLPLGHLRLRSRGSDGGHNGLASVIMETGTDRIPRLRCGVDFSTESPDLAEYVLSPFKEEELPHAAAMIDRAAEAAIAIMDIGMQRAMNVFNTPPTTQQDSL